MFPLRSPRVHVASAGGRGEEEARSCLMDCQRALYVCMYVCTDVRVYIFLGVDRPKQMCEPNYCNPARGASERWMMTMFRSAGGGHGRIRRSGSDSGIF